MSSITRGPTDLHHEGYIDPVDFDGNDVFFLDGNRIVSTSNGYRTETATFSKITYNGSNHNNPSSIEVKTKDGRILEYGNTDDSKIEALALPMFIVGCSIELLTGSVITLNTPIQKKTKSSTLII